jgi:hypothetical protein
MRLNTQNPTLELIKPLDFTFQVKKITARGYAMLFLANTIVNPL